MEGFIPIGKAFVSVKSVKWVACDEEKCEFQIGKEPVSRVTKVGMPETYKDIKARYDLLKEIHSFPAPPRSGGGGANERMSE